MIAGVSLCWLANGCERGQQRQPHRDTGTNLAFPSNDGATLRHDGALTLDAPFDASHCADDRCGPTNDLGPAPEDQGAACGDSCDAGCTASMGTTSGRFQGIRAVYDRLPTYAITKVEGTIHPKMRIHSPGNSYTSLYHEVELIVAGGSAPSDVVEFIASPVNDGSGRTHYWLAFWDNHQAWREDCTKGFEFYDTVSTYAFSFEILADGYRACYRRETAASWDCTFCPETDDWQPYIDGVFSTSELTQFDFSTLLQLETEFRLENASAGAQPIAPVDAFRYRGTDCFGDESPVCDRVSIKTQIDGAALTFHPAAEYCAE